MRSVTIRRRVQWIDTDAAGIWHHSLATRWAEEAEAELHRELGIIDETFGATPRVRTEFDFSDPLRFDDEVLASEQSNPSEALTRMVRFR